MRKIVIIFIIANFTSGCAVNRFSQTDSTGRTSSGNILADTKNQNISNNSYFIQKAEIEIITNEGKQKFIGTVKFEKPDSYLISLKSRTGIEGARIFITKDTILINDRMNKKLYSGTADYLKLKYGISQDLMPLIFGDIILNPVCENKPVKCSDNELNIDCPVKGILLKYSINCNKAKTGMVTFVDQGVRMKYIKYFNSGNILIPRTVEFRSEKYNTTINIKVVKVEVPWNGNVSFVSGKGYELIELR